MRRRVLLRVGVLAGVVLAVALLALPDLRWWAWGRLRGEAFYKGRPTSYYAGRLRAGPHGFVALANPGPGTRLSLRLVALPGSPGRFSAISILYRLIGLRPPPPEEVLFDLEDGDRLVPVLGELLKDHDSGVAATACQCLSILGPAARPSAPALAAALASRDRGDESLRVEMASTLLKMGPPPEQCVPALVVLLRAKDKSTGRAGAHLLGDLGPAAKAAVPDLIEAMQDDDVQVREEAAQALKKIDPKAAAEAGVP